jgi:WD40 repeat protein
MKNDTVSRWKGICLFGLLAAFSTIVSAKEFANVEYLCCAWGPAMTLPSKAGEKPQFDDSQDEVYFLKQRGTFTRGLMGGEQGHGISIYLCNMKPDGSEKTEIKELWRDPNYPIDTQDCSTWMDVCVKTHEIALTVTYAGSDITGLWTVNLDGSDLRRIITPSHLKAGLQSVGGVGWMPDGQSITFGESIRGADRNGRIARCDKNGERQVYLTDGPLDHFLRVSPDGKSILYVHNPMRMLGKNVAGQDMWVAETLWLMNADGANNREIPNPEAKPFWPTKGVWGSFPAWSPDGKNILVECTIIDVTSGKVSLERRPMVQGQQGTYGWPHWGKAGIVGSVVNGILLTDLELREAKWIGSSKLVECSGANESCRW